jgi:hypothetical protein
VQNKLSERSADEGKVFAQDCMLPCLHSFFIRIKALSAALMLASVFPDPNFGVHMCFREKLWRIEA